MIKLDVEDYCQECSEFEPDVMKDVCTNGSDVYYRTIVSCKGRRRCEYIASCVKKTYEKQHCFGFNGF